MPAMPHATYIETSEEIGAALAEGRAVVALESSIIAHGFPPPANRALADDLVSAVRRAGAVPAMIAVLDGRVRVGLDEVALDRLSAGRDGAGRHGTGRDIAKASTRDLGPLIAARRDAGTTVAATARIAARIGIRVFATGGIGGVHRRLPGDPGPLDVSADLGELARTPIAVVTAGAKSILDLPATLEMLETFGIGLIGFGTDRLPAFHSRESGLPLAHRADRIDTLAAAVRGHLDLAGSAILVCNPPPAAVAIPWPELAAWVDQALAEAQREGIAGQRVTPFLLAALNRLSGGRTEAVNRALALANAETAARLAAALAG